MREQRELDNFPEELILHIASFTRFFGKPTDQLCLVTDQLCLVSHTFNRLVNVARNSKFLENASYTEIRQRVMKDRQMAATLLKNPELADKILGKYNLENQRITARAAERSCQVRSNEYSNHNGANWKMLANSHPDIKKLILEKYRDRMDPNDAKELTEDPQPRAGYR